MEQPLPPYGACLLGSFNAPKYIKTNPETKEVYFDYEEFRHDIPTVVRAMDNVIDRAVYPLQNQQVEAQNKRRMGLGLTGLANAIEALGHPYGTEEYLKVQDKIMELLRDTAYWTSVSLAREKGPFPLYAGNWLNSGFAKTLPEKLRLAIQEYGVRNSHLLSIAPTGTISLSADNVSSGIEPVFSLEYDRTIQTFDGPISEHMEDYGFKVFGTKARTADQVPVEDHVAVLNRASYYVDSACSKTCNVGSDVTWKRFKNVYMLAYDGGASGCTTFRAEGKRFGILNASASEEEAVPKKQEESPKDFVSEGGACYVDPATGTRTCDQ